MQTAKDMWGRKRTESNEDYYFNEDGLMVFTEKYHLKRGYCCESGCKHCPYPKMEQPKRKKVNYEQRV